MTKVYTPKEYAAHLKTAGKRLHPEATKTVNRAAISIRDKWFKLAREKNPRIARRYPYSIRASYAKITEGTIVATIEPRGPKSSQASLGSILEYGGAHNAPQRSHIAAADAEAPNLAKWLAKLAAREV